MRDPFLFGPYWVTLMFRNFQIAGIAMKGRMMAKLRFFRNGGGSGQTSTLDTRCQVRIALRRLDDDLGHGCYGGMSVFMFLGVGVITGMSHAQAVNTGRQGARLAGISWSR